MGRSGTLWDALGRFWDALGRSGMAHDSARTDPRWPKTAPREPKIASGTPKTASRWPQDGPREPKIAPRRLKITPGWPKMAPRWPRLPLSWACLGPSWHPPKIMKNVSPGRTQNGPKVCNCRHFWGFGSEKCGSEAGAHTTPFGRSRRNTSSHASKEAGFREKTSEFRANLGSAA